MTAHLVVFGAGGHGKVVADVARSAGYDLAGFIDDDPARQRQGVWGLPVLSWEAAQADATFSRAAIGLGIGDNAARQRCCARVVASGRTVATLVHASAVVAPTATLGAGTVVMALAAVNPDARVSEGVILNTGSVVEHDCLVGRFAHLSPNCALGGGAAIGDRAHLGLGAVVLPLVRIGADVRVGAGAVAHRDLADGVTAVGVPARPIQSRS